MSGNNLSVDGELRYIIQWFSEWSELQRDDFLPIVTEYLTKDSGTHYMNGVVNSLSAASFDEKPMSLFQCRVSIFFIKTTQKLSRFLLPILFCFVCLDFNIYSVIDNFFFVLFCL